LFEREGIERHNEFDANGGHLRSNIIAHRQSGNEFILEEIFRNLNLEYWFFKGNTNAHTVLDQSLLDEDDHQSMLLVCVHIDMEQEHEQFQAS